MDASQHSTGRERARSRKTEPPAPDDQSPAPERPRIWIASAEPPVTSPLVTGTFRRAVLAGPDGEPARRPDGEPIPAIVRSARGKDGNVSDSIIHIGSWRVVGRYRLYGISHKRGLEKPEWHEWATIESIDAEGHSSIVDVAAGDLRQPLARCSWLDACGIGFSAKASYVRDYTRALVMQTDTATMIKGQGPFYFDDETPSCTLSKKLAFAARSIMFDADGEIPGIETKLPAPNKGDYYDITPASLITGEQIQEGIQLLKFAYDECPNYPAIPAAFIGQQLTAFIVAVRTEFHSGILLTGLMGSGKTKYAARWDAIQARGDRFTRGPLGAIEPVINLGDRRGTGKGTGYKITKYGGYAITIDDVLKDGDSEIKVRDQSQLVRDLVSSYESGGAPLGYVDRTANDVTFRSSPALHSSVKIMSEIPLTGASTLERLIVLPHIGDKWGTGHVFNRGIAETLSTAEAREAQHLAYSAYVQWAFQRIESDLDECLTKAQAETATWDVPARTQEKYAAVLAGHFMFKRFCEAYEIDINEQIAGATSALRANAKIQASTTLPLYAEWAKSLRRMIIRDKIAFPGRPIPEADGIAPAYGVPWIETDEIAGEGAEAVKHRTLPLTLRELGLWMVGSEHTPIPKPGAKIYGLIIPPPSSNKRGRKRADDSLSTKWRIACWPEAFAEMCDQTGLNTGMHGRSFDANAVMNNLRAAGLGEVTREYMTNPATQDSRKRVWVFDMDLLRQPEGDK